jgi:hypothetical protein
MTDNLMGSQSKSSGFLRPPPRLRVNASRGIVSKAKRSTKAHHKEDGKEKRELYVQRRAKQREQVEENTAANIEYLQELDLKERMLEVLSAFFGKLAADENRLKGLVEGSLPEVSFHERAKEVEEAYWMLKIRDHPSSVGGRRALGSTSGSGKGVS